MNEMVLQHISIPVLMLMIKDLEFHRAEYSRDNQPVVNLDSWIATCKAVLKEKTEE